MATSRITFDPSTRGWFEDTNVKEGLVPLPSLDGTLVIESRSCESASTDFGNIVAARPSAVLYPGSTRDIATIASFCQEHRVLLAMRGQGHSTNGQALVSGGIVIDSSTWNSVRNVSATHIVVDAGIQWRDVLAVTLPLGLTPPVLPDYLGLSVGGTLAVGGLGGTSAIYGAQADNVESLELVLLNGDTIDCSATCKSDLFHNTLCGLGQCALITRATLKLVHAPTKVRRLKLSYRELGDLVFDQDRLIREGRFDYLEGQIYADDTGAWRYILEAGKFLDSFGNHNNHDLLAGLTSDGKSIEVTELSYLEFLERMEPSVARFKRTGEWDNSHPWLNLFLPASETAGFVNTAIEALRPEEIGASGVLLLYPLKRSNFWQLMLRVPKEDIFFLFALLRAVPRDAKSVNDIILDNGSLYHKAKSIGGELYPVGTINMTPRNWAEHFGEVWPTLKRAKDHYDRDHLLAPGHGIFTGSQDKT